MADTTTPVTNEAQRALDQAAFAAAMENYKQFAIANFTTVYEGELKARRDALWQATEDAGKKLDLSESEIGPPELGALWHLKALHFLLQDKSPVVATTPDDHDSLLDTNPDKLLRNLVFHLGGFYMSGLNAKSENFKEIYQLYFRQVLIKILASDVSMAVKKEAIDKLPEYSPVDLQYPIVREILAQPEYAANPAVLDLHRSYYKGLLKDSVMSYDFNYVRDRQGSSDWDLDLAVQIETDYFSALRQAAKKDPLTVLNFITENQDYQVWSPRLISVFAEIVTMAVTPLYQFDETNFRVDGDRDKAKNLLQNVVGAIMASPAGFNRYDDYSFLSSRGETGEMVALAVLPTLAKLPEYAKRSVSPYRTWEANFLYEMISRASIKAENDKSKNFGNSCMEHVTLYYMLDQANQALDRGEKGEAVQWLDGLYEDRRGPQSNDLYPRKAVALHFMSEFNRTYTRLVKAFPIQSLLDHSAELGDYLTFPNRAAIVADVILGDGSDDNRVLQAATILGRARHSNQISIISSPTLADVGKKLVPRVVDLMKQYQPGNIPPDLAEACAGVATVIDQVDPALHDQFVAGMRRFVTKPAPKQSSDVAPAVNGGYLKFLAAQLLGGRPSA